MNSMKRLVFASVAVLSLSLAYAADPPALVKPLPPSQLTPLMQMKLEKSKTILEGLALEDFEKIASNAQLLRLLSMESGWNVIQTEEYAAQSQDFRRSADLIIAAAKDKDIHRAAIGYVALTVRCVECHSYMRKHRNELLKQ